MLSFVGFIWAFGSLAPYLIILVDVSIWLNLILIAAMIVLSIVIYVKVQKLVVTNKGGFALFGVGCATFLLFTPAFFLASPQAKLNDSVIWLAHRGLSSRYFPNSYQAITGAINDDNFDGMEVDLQLTNHNSSNEAALYISHFDNPFAEDTSERISQ